MLTFLKLIAILCMILLIVLLLMAMGFIPSQKIIKLIKDKRITQVILGIASMVGLCATFLILLKA